MEMETQNHTCSSVLIAPSSQTDILIQLYLTSLDEKKLLAYQIAKSQLGTSFCLEKSNDFLQWCSTLEHNKL